MCSTFGFTKNFSANISVWGAQNFNQDISGWNISRNTIIDYMFKNEKSFRDKIVREHDPNAGLEEIKIIYYKHIIDS